MNSDKIALIDSAMTGKLGHIHNKEIRSVKMSKFGRPFQLY